MSQKSYDNTPSLYLIPTPIGNLDDITLRAIKTIEMVEVIFSEDTRITKMLLNHLNIKKKLIANHKYNETENAENVIEYLEKGYNVGLVSDRGTPIISDPGYYIVKKVIEKGYNVIGLPGATALIPALIVSGIDTNRFIFFGFLNNKESKRKKELEEIKKHNLATIIYEAPHRLQKTLGNMLEILGDRYISISREISKKYEEVYRGKISEILSEMSEPKGEFVIVIDSKKDVNTYDNLTIVEHVNMYIKEGYEIKEAMKLVAKERKISKSEVYSQYHG